MQAITSIPKNCQGLNKILIIKMVVHQYCSQYTSSLQHSYSKLLPSIANPLLKRIALMGSESLSSNLLKANEAMLVSRSQKYDINKKKKLYVLQYYQWAMGNLRAHTLLYIMLYIMLILCY